MREVLTLAFVVLFSVFVTLPATRRYVARRTEAKEAFARRAAESGCVAEGRLRGRRRYRISVQRDGRPTRPLRSFERGRYVYRISPADRERRTSVRTAHSLPDRTAIYFDPEALRRYLTEGDVSRGVSGVPCTLALTVLALALARAVYLLLGGLPL